MKNVYMLSAVLLSAVTLNAQMLESKNAGVFSNGPITPTRYQTPFIEKNQGDVLWQDDFSTAANWQFVAGTAQTAGNVGQWNIISTFPAGLISQAPVKGFPTAMNSASGGNYAFINSDEAGNGKNQDAYFMNTTPINLSTTTAGTALYLQFTNIYRKYRETYGVEVSKDNGVTWIPFVVNGDVKTNTNSKDPEIEQINITSANLAGASQVKIRFHYVGAYDWFWGVDDVKIIEAYGNDGWLQQTYMFTDTATTSDCDYYMIPTSQLSAFPGHKFKTIAYNNGFSSQSQFKIKATGTNYSQLSNGGITNPDLMASNASDTFFIDTPFNPTTAGNYTVTLTVDLGATVDANRQNDTLKLGTIKLGGEDYARDNGVKVENISRMTSEVAGFFNMFDIFADYTAGSVKVYIPAAQPSGIGQSTELKADVRKYNGETDKWDLVMTCEYVQITSAEFGKWITLRSEDGKVTMTPGQYMVGIYRQEDGANTLIFGGAQESVEGTVGTINVPDANGEYTYSGIADPNALMLRLSGDYASGAGIEEQTVTTRLNIYPNPATNVAHVNFNLNSETDVTYTVTDLTGKVMVNTTILGAKSGVNSFDINTQTLTNGIYFLNMTTNGVVSKQRFVVNK